MLSRNIDFFLQSSPQLFKYCDIISKICELRHKEKKFLSVW